MKAKEFKEAIYKLDNAKQVGKFMARATKGTWTKLAKIGKLKQKMIKIKTTDNYCNKCCGETIIMQLYLIDKDEVYLALCPKCHKLFWAGVTYNNKSIDNVDFFEKYNGLDKVYKKVIKTKHESKKCKGKRL